MRLPVLLSSINIIYNDTDELTKGNVAIEIINGLKMPLFDYQIPPFMGGSLFEGIIAVPFFVVFGPTIISLVMMALCFSLGTLILWYLFCNKFFNLNISILIGLLFIFSPPLLTRFSLVPVAAHPETTFFTISILYIFYHIIHENKINYVYFFAFGMISGLGLWFAYIFSSTLITCFLFWFVFDRRFIFKKSFLVYITSFILGFSPWIYYNLTHDWTGFIVKDTPLSHWFLQYGFLSFLNKLGLFWTLYFRNSFNFKIFLGLGGYVWSSIYYFIFLISFIGLFYFNRRSILNVILRLLPIKKFVINNSKISKESLLLFFPLIFSLVYSLSKIEIENLAKYWGYKYFVPLYPFVFFTISLFFYKLTLLSKKYGKLVYIIVSIFLIFIGLVNNLKLIDHKKFGIGMHYLGFSYNDLGEAWGEKKDDDILLNMIQNIDKKHRKFFCQGLGNGLGKKYKGNIEEFIKIINKTDKNYHNCICQGFASRIHEYDQDPDNSIRLISGLDKECGSFFYEELGRFIKKIYDLRISIYKIENMNINDSARGLMYKGLLTDSSDDFDIFKNIREEERMLTINNLHNLYEGLGRSYVETLWEDRKEFEKLNNLNKLLNADEITHFYLGLGWRIGFVIGEDPYICRDWINKIDEKYRKYSQKGLNQFLNDIDDK